MKKLKYGTRRKLNGVVLLLPWIFGFFLFFLTPLIQTFYYSFCDVSVRDTGGMNLAFSGFQNYINLFTSEVTSTNQTVVRLLADENVRILTKTPILVIFSLFLAILVNFKFKGRGFVRVIFFLPIVLGLDLVVKLLTISTGADLLGLSSTGVFANKSVAAFLQEYIELPRQVSYGISIFVENIYQWISQAGVQTLIYLAGLQSISPSFYEVADIEGATPYETFWKVTLPSISNITLFVAVYTMVSQFLSSPIATEVYNFAFNKSEIGVGSSLSVVYLLNVLVVLVIIMALLNRQVKKSDPNR